ncbi:MAG: TonB-dependent receptor [Rikenellaceae bacterium]
MKRLFTFILLSIFTLSVGVAQAANDVRGQVLDSESGEPIIGATLYVAKKQVGTVTDALGEFQLKGLAQGDLIDVSYLGYQPKRIMLQGAQTVITVKISPETQTIDEVVVVGYGTMRKSDLTGAMVSLKPDDVNQENIITDISSILDGRVAGLSVSLGEGGPGSGASVSIRGASSVHADTEPLYVIDGFPIEATDSSLPSDGFEVSGTVSPLSNIDPSNIASIEVLKDASATAIYGSRGANGVIIITTKSGEKGRVKVNLNASYGISFAASKVDMLDAAGYGEYLYRRSFRGSDNPYASEVDPDVLSSGYCEGYKLQHTGYATYNDSGMTNTDWQDLLYKMGRTQNYSVTLSGGSDRFLYNVNGGYFDDVGIIDNSYFTRYSLDSKLRAEISKRLSFDLSTRLGHTLSDGAASGVGGNSTNIGVTTQILTYSPLKSMDDVLGTGVDYETYEDLSDSEDTNPFNFINDVTNTTSTTRLLTNGSLNYKIMDDLTYKGSMGVNINESNKKTFYPSTTAKGDDQNGYGSLANNLTRAWVHESTLTYNKQINKSHRINAMATFTAEEKYAETMSMVNTDFDYQELGIYNIGLGVDPSVPSSSWNKNQLCSWLSRVNYTWRDRYLVTLTGRADGSSKFSTGSKWALFPASSVAWRMSQEEWWGDLKKIANDVKVRASYGVTGNQNIGNYANLAIVGVSNYTFSDETASGLALSSLGNVDLKWERTEQYNVGADIAFLKNRFTLSVDAYHKITSDMLMDVEVTTVSGYSDYTMNYGSVENRGLEISFGGTIMNKKDFRWSANANVALNRSNVLSLGNQDYLSYDHARVMVGQPLGTFWGYKQEGIIANEEEMNKYNQEGLFMSLMSVGQRKLADLDPSSSTSSKVVIDTNDQTIIGCAEALFEGGFSTNFNYKGFGLSMQFKYSYGGDVFNGYKQMLSESEASKNRHSSVLDYWRPATDADGGNTDSMVPHPSADDMTEYIDVWVEDGSYLKLSSATLNYTFKKAQLRKIGLSSLMVYVRGTNLFTWTPYTGTDPTANMGSKLAPGLDKGGKPFVKSFAIGFNCGF